MERREAVRAYVRFPVSYTTKPLGKTVGSAWTKDVSPEGVRLVLPDRLTTGATLGLTLNLQKDQPPLMVSATVAWQDQMKTSPTASQPRFVTGLQFTELEDDGKEQLETLVKERLMQQSEGVDSEFNWLLDQEWPPQNKEFVFSKRVFLKDTNAEGNAYFARYFDWQGEAREEFFRRAVPNHLEILQSGTKLITVHAWLKYEHEGDCSEETWTIDPSCRRSPAARHGAL